MDGGHFRSSETKFRMLISLIPGHESLLKDRIFGMHGIRDDCQAAMRAFKVKVEEGGGRIHTFDLLPPERADVILLYGSLYFTEQIKDVLARSPDKIVIGICREPPHVDPLFYDSTLASSFDYLYLCATPKSSHSYVKHLGFAVTKYATEWLPYEQRRLATTIISCKFALFQGSLYLERFKSLLSFQKEVGDQFSFYGEGWERLRLISLPKSLPSYSGTCIDKQSILRQYRFSICYENCSNQPGYVSEKIYDSMQAGCIPIYWGAPDIERYVPSDCFIDRRSFRNDRDVVEYVKYMPREVYDAYLFSIRRYLDSKQFSDAIVGPYSREVMHDIQSGPRSSTRVLSREAHQKLRARLMIQSWGLRTWREKNYRVKELGNKYLWIEIVRKVVARIGAKAAALWVAVVCGTSMLLNLTSSVHASPMKHRK